MKKRRRRYLKSDLAAAAYALSVHLDHFPPGLSLLDMDSARFIETKNLRREEIGESGEDRGEKIGERHQ